MTKYPLLPRSEDQGWLPYLWLVYLTYFLLAGQSNWPATLAGTVVFLGLYFYGYWVQGGKLALVIAGLCALGVGYSQSNIGSLVFFIYAASFTGRIGSTPQAVRALVAVEAVVLVNGYFQLLRPENWLSPAVFSAILGTVTIFYAQRSRMRRKLEMAQDEVARLAKIAERERIARDLHDLLGHTLSLIVIKSELASRLAESDPARAISEIRDVEKVSREALAQVRSAVRGFRGNGLSAELEQTSVLMQAAGIEFEPHAEPIPLSPTQENVLVLALREAATNVVRHAHAKSCQLWLRQGQGSVEFEIQDDGRGGPLNEGCGLAGMRERVEGLGGSMERNGANGVKIFIRLPAALS